MKKPTVQYFRTMHFHPENIAYLENNTYLWTDPYPGFQFNKHVEVVFAGITVSWDDEMLAKYPRCKYLVSNTSSHQHIDTDACRKRGVTIISLLGEEAFLEEITPTIEHTWGLIHAIHRRIPAAHNDVCQNVWDRRRWPAPRMLSRMSLGVVGFGRIGDMVGCIGEQFGMRVGYYDPYIPNTNRQAQPTLLGLAAESDILVICCSLTSETIGLVSKEVLRALPKGALVVNTARGEILDEDALLAGLIDGHIRGAALDVMAGEFQEARNTNLTAYAQTYDNLIITPHIGGSTIDAWHSTEHHVIDLMLQEYAK